MLNDNEYTEFENRKYLNPQIMVDESNAFIDNLRNTQQANNQQIRNQTYNLGTQVPSNLGGLVGGESYFTSRYQTPQTNSAVDNLRAAAQASALNQTLANEREMWKKRYNDAYRNYQKRTNGGGSGGSGGGDEGEDPDFVGTGELTGLRSEQDVNDYTRTATITDSVEVAGDNRNTERGRNVKVYKDNNGNVDTIIVNGVPYYGRNARAKYRYLQAQGLVR